MADLPTLQSLHARVCAASGPNLALECELFEALEFPTDFFGSRIESHWHDGPVYGVNTADGTRHLSALRAPNYTASIDSALALVERVLPGALWRVEKLAHSPGPPFWATAGLPGQQEAAYSDTAPLAILAALFAALIAQHTKEPGNGT